MKEIPVEIIGGEDGTFDNGDLVIFYADAADSWEYSTQFQRFQHYRNHYTDKNVYWLTFDGTFSEPPRRFIVTDGAPDSAYDVSVDTYEALYHKEQEVVFWVPDPRSGPYDEFEWYWGYDRTFTSAAQLYDVASGGEGTVIARRQGGNPSLRVNGGTPIPPENYPTYSTYRTTSLVEGLNTLQLESITSFFLDYFDVHYPRLLKVVDGNLGFSQPDTFGVIRYNLTQVSSPYFLYDISDKRNPVKIAGGNLNGSNLVFHDTVSASSHKLYCFSSRDRLKSPGSVSLYRIDNLKDLNSPQNRADEIIITYDGFYDAAVRLAEHRRASYGLATRVVKVSDIYDQFSYGLFDATAIKDLLKYAYENWPDPAPTFALLAARAVITSRKDIL